MQHPIGSGHNLVTGKAVLNKALLRSVVTKIGRSAEPTASTNCDPTGPLSRGGLTNGNSCKSPKQPPLALHVFGERYLCGLLVSCSFCVLNFIAKVRYTVLRAKQVGIFDNTPEEGTSRSPGDFTGFAWANGETPNDQSPVCAGGLLTEGSSTEHSSEQVERRLSSVEPATNACGGVPDPC
jgi:hypothetical protein